MSMGGATFIGGLWKVGGMIIETGPCLGVQKIFQSYARSPQPFRVEQWAAHGCVCAEPRCITKHISLLCGVHIVLPKCLHLPCCT